MILLNDNIEQPDNIVVARVLYFTQIAQCGYFATEKVPGDFVVYRREVNAFDGYFGRRIVVSKTQKDIACAAFPQQFVLTNGELLVDGSDLLLHEKIAI